MRKLLLIIAVFVITACGTSPVKEVVYVPVTDAVTVTDREQIIALEHKCNLLQDSLNMIKDSLGEDLFIAKYKLGRIKYYTDIAGKKNNLKYLRGWLYRTLKE